MLENPPVNSGDIRGLGLIPVSGRSAGGGHSIPIQYSCLGNPMDRGAWRATVHGVTKSWTWLKQLSNTNRVTDKICMQTLSTIKLFLKIASKAHSTGVQRGITTISFMGIKTSLSMHRICYYEWGRHCPILVAQVREVGTEVRSGSSQGSHFLQQQLQHWDSPLLLARRTRACLPRQGHGFIPGPGRLLMPRA